MNIYLPIVIAVLVLTPGLAVIISNRRDRASIIFVLLSLSLGTWVVANALVDEFPADALTLVRMAFFAPMWSAVLFREFVLSFPVTRKRAKATRVFNWSAAILMSVLVWTDLFIPSVEFVSGVATVVPGALYLLFPVYIVYLMVVSLVTLYRNMHTLHGVSRRRVQLVAMAAAITGVLGLLVNILVPIVFGTNEFAAWGTYSTLIFTAFIGYAMFRHQLFDIRIAIARTFAYVMTLTVLAIAYAMALFSVSLLLLDLGNVGWRTVVTYTLLALMLAFSFQVIKRFFDRLSNKIFFKNAYDPQQFLDRLNKTLAGQVELESLLRKTGQVIQDNLKSEFCIFTVRKAGHFPARVIGNGRYDLEELNDVLEYVRQRPEKLIIAGHLDDKDQLLQKMNQLNVGFISKLTMGKEWVGEFVVGGKRSGELYTKLDINILEISSNELVIAIQNALRFAEIQRFNETLQEKVDAATRQLREKNERLKVLDQTKDDFISMASHQLRTPLTSVKGYVSMVLDGDAGKISPMQRKLLNQSYVSSQRMVYLISDLLNVSRLSTGKFELEQVPTDLAQVAQDEISQLLETADARNLKLIYVKPEHFPTYMLDETKLRQVIMNFVDNAIYYTPSDGKIEVKLTEGESAIELTVTDTGIGVPKHDVPHVFTKYFRAGNAKVARPDGTGLGLFMAKKVVIAHGGAVIFRTREHRGSTFGFTLPKKALQVPVEK